MLQYVLVAIVLAAAVAYVVYRIYDAVRRAGDPCYGCAGCALRDQMRRRRTQKPRPTCPKDREKGR